MFNCFYVYEKRVDLKRSSNPLTKQEILAILSNNREQSNIIVAIVEKIDDKDIKVAKDILKSSFQMETLHLQVQENYRVSK